jgi:hypothetical protein
MKKIASAFISLLGVSVIFCCKQKSSFNNAINGQSLLWEITGNGLKSPSYFLGTMHLMCAEDAVLSNNVLKIIGQVDTIYLEIDMDNAGELLGGMVDMALKDNRTLRDILSGEDYAKVKNFFEKFQKNMPFALLEKQPPLMISSSLYELLLPCEKKNGVELKIIDEAYKQKKETKGLETFAFQSSIFDSIPYEVQAKDLVNTIDSLDKYKKDLGKMISVYKSQNINKLFELTANDSSGTSGYMDLLLYRRNKNWVEQFPGITNNNSALFAVGAGHLGGEKGVINLLRQNGYTARAIEN